MPERGKRDPERKEQGVALDFVMLREEVEEVEEEVEEEMEEEAGGGWRSLDLSRSTKGRETPR